MNEYQKMCLEVKAKVALASTEDLFAHLIEKIEELSKENAELKAKYEQRT